MTMESFLRVRDDSDDSNVSDWPWEAYHYHPSKDAAMAAFVINMILAVAILVRLTKRRNKWGLCLPIGMICYALGFFARYKSAQFVKVEPLLTVSAVLIIVSPATFLAFNYILYGRILHYGVGARKGFSLVRANWVSKLFVTSDILTFLLQIAGSGLMNADSSGSTVKLGKTILLIGMASQIGPYVIYVLLVAHTHMKLREDRTINPGESFPWILFYIIYFSSVFITIRGAYRTAEMAGGEFGSLYTHEGYFYALDTFPLLFVTAIYAFLWPGRWLARLDAGKGSASDSTLNEKFTSDTKNIV